MAAPTTLRASRFGSPYVPLLVTYDSVVVLGMCLAWVNLSMRAVAGVGGSCASGGALDVVTPCPDGSWLVSLAIPLVLVATFVGTGFASVVGAPSLLLPMWALLFTTTGWQFLEQAFTDGFGFGYLLCGVLFWALAAPAWVVLLRGAAKIAKAQPAPAKPGGLWDAGSVAGALSWWGIYALLGTAGAFLGVGIYAWAS